VRLSVVVASFSGEASLRSCLDSLGTEHGGAEVIVSAALDPEAMDALARHYPGAQLVPAPAGTSVFALRARGLARATGDVAALVEDHCVAGPGWLRALADVAGDAAFAGGAVESGPVSSLADWALYLVEYGALMPPVAGGEALLAVNAAYPRRALEACRPVWEGGFHDNEVHDALRARGHRPLVVAGATVRSHLRLTLDRAMAHLFQGGRRFGAYRRARSRARERGLRLLAAPLVPFVLLARLAGRVARRRPRALPRLAVALPWVVCLLAAWSAGELAGQVAPASPGTR
jgi:Glycosyltransferase like family 2